MIGPHNLRAGDLVSLWDMLSLNAAKFVKANHVVATSGQVFMIHEMGQPGAPLKMRRDSLRMLVKESAELLETLRDMRLSMTSRSGEKLHERLKKILNRRGAAGTHTTLSGEDVNGVRGLTTELSIRLKEELQDRVLLLVPPEDTALLEQPTPLFGTEVEGAFPSAAEEIAEAGKCRALGRSSAAVFHLMRTLEVGLGALAKAMAVTPSNPNWENVINEIEVAIKGMSKLTHGADWRDAQHFYSEAAAHFRVLKNAWRNYAMHLHERYDEQRARDIYDSVGGFMRHLATRLKE